MTKGRLKAAFFCPGFGSRCLEAIAAGTKQTDTITIL